MQNGFSDARIEQFIKDLIRSDGGFAQIHPYILEHFARRQFRKRGFPLTPEHPDWEEVLNDASDELIDGE